MRSFVAYLSLLAILLHGVLGMPAFGGVVCVGGQAAAAPAPADDCCKGKAKPAGTGEPSTKQKSDAGSPTCHCCKVVQASNTDLPKPVSAGIPKLIGLVPVSFEPLLSTAVVLPAVPPPRA